VDAENLDPQDVTKHAVLHLLMMIVEFVVAQALNLHFVTAMDMWTKAVVVDNLDPRDATKNVVLQSLMMFVEFVVAQALYLVRVIAMEMWTKAVAAESLGPQDVTKNAVLHSFMMIVEFAVAQALYLVRVTAMEMWTKAVAVELRVKVYVRKLIVNRLQRVKIFLSNLYTKAMVRHKDVSNTMVAGLFGSKIVSIIQIVAQTDVMDAKLFPTALV
jgi:hypothetical protein